MSANAAPRDQPLRKKTRLRRYVSRWPGVIEALLLLFALAFQFGNRDTTFLAIPIINAEVGVVVIALAIVVATAVAGWIATQRDLRNFRDIKPTRIGTAASGYVEFAGHCLPVPGRTLRSKYLGEPCVWCGFEDEDRKGRAVIREDGALDAPFILYDQTGSCLVQPGGAVVEESHRDRWDDAHHRYTEWKLLEGSEVIILGEYTRSRNAAPRFAADMEPEKPEHLRAPNAGDFAAILETVRRDYQEMTGPQSLARTPAWSRIVAERTQSVARARMQASAWSSRREALAGTQREDGVLARPADGRPFLITANNREVELGRKTFSRNSQVLVAVVSLAWLVGKFV